MDEYRLIANPVSGRGRGRERAETVAAILRQRDAHVEICYTNAPGDAERLAEDAATTRTCGRCIVACGGDGTMQQVANAVARVRAAEDEQQRCNNHTKKMPSLYYGLAPSGRGNDFGRALGIPPVAEQIADILLTGETRAVDLGMVNERYFCTVATIGIDAEISRFVDSEMRLPLKGMLAYAYGALRVLLWYQARQMKIDGDFGSHDECFYVASVANTASYGGGMEIAPDARPDDGKLDICLMSPLSRWAAMTMVLSALRGRIRERREVRFETTREVTIAPLDTAEVWADGERVAQTPARFRVAPGALSVLLPK